MPTLSEFLVANRDTIIERAADRVKKRIPNRPRQTQLEVGIPLFLNQLVGALGKQTGEGAGSDGLATTANEIGRSAALHGAELLKSGFTLEQVVHGYGDVCQLLTELAVEAHTQISAQDFHVFNRCLDDAIAGAVTEFGNQRERDLQFAGIERQGIFAHEVRNLLHTAILSFEALRTGSVGVGGSTGALHARSLGELNVLVERALAEVRVGADIPHSERLHVAELIGATQVSAELLAVAQRIKLTVGLVAADLMIDVDRQLIGSALMNLLQNAFKFTGANGTVSLMVRTTAERVQLDVADECGGLPAGRADALFLPFTQESSDRSGLGLGLSIALSAVRACSGTLSVRDDPGHGCIFTIDLPLQRELHAPTAE